jgi:hypothetical protein
MKKLVICLLAAFFCLRVNAQTPDVYHGINAGASRNMDFYDSSAPSVGYFLDMHLRGRTWLFTQFNLERYYLSNDISYWGTNEYSYSIYDLYVPVRFAFRLGKEDAKFTFYPTVGFGLYIPLVYYYKETNGNVTEKELTYGGEDQYVYPLFNMGFEAKWHYSQKHNLGIGFNTNYQGYGLHTNVYLKFGWNKYNK